MNKNRILSSIGLALLVTGVITFFVIHAALSHGNIQAYGLPILQTFLGLVAVFFSTLKLED